MKKLGMKKVDQRNSGAEAPHRLRWLTRHG
jgi:hypothetical protein